MQAVDVLPMVEDKEKTKDKHSHDVSCQREQEEEEVAIVPSANAVVHPWTVVVEVLHHENQKNTVVRKSDQNKHSVLFSSVL